MSEQFLNALTDTGNRATTENGATAFATTKSDVLDFFSLGGALRNRSAKDQVNHFARAWNENPELALKAMFYFRDVRGGQGQRGAFRNQLKWLADVSPETVSKNLRNVPEFGRWDDLFVLDGTPSENDMWKLIRSQLMEDMVSSTDDEIGISLLAKWMKSTYASNEESKRLARKTRKVLGWSEKHYRKVVSNLRKHIGVLERQLEANNWKEVDYSHVPSQAMMKYRNAFRKHDSERFGSYIDSVNKGEAKINAGTLYPHDIVGRLLLGYRDNPIRADEAQAMWDALPDYIPEGENSICVVDTSASMQGTPMEVSIALGLYAAERAKGPYKDHFITFSHKPKLQKVVGSNIKAKVDGLKNADWEMNTDIEAVFDLILTTAISNRISQEDMIDKLYIISDMEFDKATSNGGYSIYGGHVNVPDATLFQTIREKFEDAGYKMPNLVFWNVDARNDQFPMSMDERGFQAVSGFSPSIFEHLVGGEFISAYDIMLNVLNSKRYENVTL